MKVKVSALLAAALALAIPFTAAASGAQEGTAGAAVPKTLKYLGQGAGLKGNPNEGPVVLALEKITGFKLISTSLPQENPGQALNLIMASGEKYDMIKNVDNSQLLTYIENGAVLPLKKLIDQHGPNIKKAVPAQVFGVLEKQSGDIYGFPSTANPTLGMTLALRTDWLQQVGLPEPKTLDDVVNVLKTIKQKDPGKIGDRLIGYTGIPWWAGGQLAFHEPFLGAFGVVHEWVEKGGKIVSRYETEEFKQYILFMNRLYREGLLDPDFAVLKRNIVDEKVSSGRVIMSLYHWDSIYKTWNAWEKEQPTWKINIIHNPTGPTGLSGAPVSAGGIGIMNFIPKNAENPIGAVQFVDAFMEPGNYLKLIIGEENVHWKMTGDKRTPILPIFDDERGNMFWYEPMRPGEVYYPLWKTRVEKIPAMGRAYTDTERVLLPIVTPSPIAMATMLKTTARNASSLMQLANDETLKFILGATNMSEYDKFVKRYMDAGGTDSKAEINAWYASK